MTPLLISNDLQYKENHMQFSTLNDPRHNPHLKTKVTKFTVAASVFLIYPKGSMPWYLCSGINRFPLS